MYTSNGCLNAGEETQKSRNLGLHKKLHETFEVRKKNWMDKVIAIHGDRYDYSLVEFKGVKKYVKIICRVHGVFNQTAEAHSSGQGCIKCRNENTAKRLTKTLEQFISEAKEVHGDIYL